MELVLTGRRFDAREAERTRDRQPSVAEKRDWLDAALELARRIASRPPLAARLAKQAVLAAEETALSAGLEQERRLYELAMATEDRVEGMQAFLEKRRPELPRALSGGERLRAEFDDAADREGFAGRRARLGRQAGSERLGASLFELEPGSAAFPMHYHLGNEETADRALRPRRACARPTASAALEQGEVVAFPVGEAGAHQIVNRDREPVRILILSEMNAPDVVVQAGVGQDQRLRPPAGRRRRGLPRRLLPPRRGRVLGRRGPAARLRPRRERADRGRRRRHDGRRDRPARLPRPATRPSSTTPSPKALERGCERLRADLERGVERGRCSERRRRTRRLRCLVAAAGLDELARLRARDRGGARGPGAEARASSPGSRRPARPTRCSPPTPPRCR